MNEAVGKLKKKMSFYFHQVAEAICYKSELRSLDVDGQHVQGQGIILWKMKIIIFNFWLLSFKVPKFHLETNSASKGKNSLIEFRMIPDI